MPQIHEYNELIAPDSAALLAIDDVTDGELKKVSLANLYRGIGRVYTPSAFTKAAIDTTLASIGMVNAATLALIPGTWTIDDDLSFALYPNLFIHMMPGAVFSVSVDKTLTLYSPANIIAQPNQQIWTGAGTLAFANNHGEVYPDWAGVDYVDDTDAVQWAFDTGKNVKFANNYRVSEVSITSQSQVINFNGHSIGGINEGADLTAVLTISGSYLTMYAVNVNARYKNYTSAINWKSDFAGLAYYAQWNVIYGMLVQSVEIGLLYGNIVDATATQSENTIYDFKSRSCRIPLYANQTSGFLTMVSPILDCNPNEWIAQPGYVAATYQTAARPFVNLAGFVSIIGGEILKTTSALGYGIEGSNFQIIGASIECAGAHYIRGSCSFLETKNGWMAANSVSVFVIDVAATGTLSLNAFTAQRPAGTAAGSGQKFARVSDSAAAGTGGTDISANFKIDMVNSRIVEWPMDKSDLGPKFLNFAYNVNNTRYSSTVFTGVITAHSPITGLSSEVSTTYDSAAWVGDVTKTVRVTFPTDTLSALGVYTIRVCGYGTAGSYYFRSEWLVAGFLSGAAGYGFEQLSLQNTAIFTISTLTQAAGYVTFTIRNNNAGVSAKFRVVVTGTNGSGSVPYITVT